MRQTLLGLAVIVLMCGPDTTASKSDGSDSVGSGHAPRTAPVFCPWGRPRFEDSLSCRLLENSGYDCGFSPRLKVARWSAYRYYRTGNTISERKDWFRPDTPRLSMDESPTPADYRGAYRSDRSGFDRGHLAPDATIEAFGRDAMLQTYLLTNVTPQYTRNNQGIWRVLEDSIRVWAGEKDTVWAVVGPVFYADRDTGRLATGRVFVPHAHFYVVARGREPEMLAVVVPNVPEKLPARRLRDYLVSVDSVEKLTGLDMFPDLSAVEQVRLESIRPAGLWPRP